MATKAKTEKRTCTYTQKYNKGIRFNDLKDVYEALKQKQVIVYPLEGSIYSDGTESMTIKIDNIDVSKR